MLVSDFLNIVVGGMFTVVDANIPGCFTRPVYLHSGCDRNAIRTLGFDKYNLIRAEAIGKNKYFLYVLPPEE